MESSKIYGSLLTLLGSYLRDRYQSVVLSNKVIDWKQTNDDVLQGSLFGSLLPLVYINDLILILHAWILHAHYGCYKHTRAYPHVYTNTRAYPHVYMNPRAYPHV